jgi:hypothetical protein
MAITKKNDQFYYDYDEELDDGSTGTKWVPVEHLKGRDRRQVMQELHKGRFANVKNRDAEEAEKLLNWMKKKRNFSDKDIKKAEQKLSAEKKLFG